MSDVPQRLAAGLADRYVLQHEIGAGGMATVYLARDLRHKRSVAVKVVRPELGGWAALLQGDSVGGIRRMRSGLDLSAAPNEESAFPRLQFALALASRPATREEGIRWLRYGFETLPLYKPLTLLALGHTYEAAGQRDSSAAAYSRFLRLWDKADPELQVRVKEAKAGLQDVSRERSGSQ